MRGILPYTEVLTLSTIKYELEKRAMVAKLLFQPLNGLHKNQVFDIKVQLVHNLAQLCYRQKTPRQFKIMQLQQHSQKQYSYTSTGTDNDNDISQEEGGGTIQRMQMVNKRLCIESTLYCSFYERGPFSRKDGLGRHVQVQHLQRRLANGGFLCPYKRCSDVMSNSVHFLSHTARKHEILL